MAIAESKGILLFSRDYKEKDKLVKIFTESAGKQMFFVKGAHRKNNPLAPALLPYTEAVYIGKFNSEGLSFLNAAKEVHPFRNIQNDIFAAAYATYMMNLADAAIEDRVYDPNLYSFLKQALLMMDQGNDGEVLTNIFEIHILQRFGIAIDWQKCAICGETHGKFDYSSAHNGVLCQRHWERDPRRYHADPVAIHFIRIFSQITYDQIKNIELKQETKKSIRQTIDALYEEYVGLHLKSKKFIDQMGDWENLLQPKT
jgi:DNA repair protein RecO (recombination protein O)